MNTFIKGALMPKIIENIKEKLTKEAKQQIQKYGYGKVTIRSIACSCGISPATVYNYFESKEMLVASFLLEDWQICLQDIKKITSECKDAKTALYQTYTRLYEYIKKYENIFSDDTAAKSFAVMSGKKHILLRDQIAKALGDCIEKHCRQKSSFAAEFIAESLLTWTVCGKDFEEIYSVIQYLFI